VVNVKRLDRVVDDAVAIVVIAVHSLRTRTKTVCTYWGVGCSFDVWTKLDTF